MNENSGVASSVAGKESASGVEQEQVSIAEPLNEKHEPDLKVEASNVKQESVSGVEPSPAQPEVEVIPASSVEVVLESDSARDSIRSLLGSLG